MLDSIFDDRKCMAEINERMLACELAYLAQASWKAIPAQLVAIIPIHVV